MAIRVCILAWIICFRKIFVNPAILPGILLFKTVIKTILPKIFRPAIAKTDSWQNTFATINILFIIEIAWLKVLAVFYNCSLSWTIKINHKDTECTKKVQRKNLRVLRVLCGEKKKINRKLVPTLREAQRVCLDIQNLSIFVEWLEKSNTFIIF